MPIYDRYIITVGFKYLLGGAWQAFSSVNGTRYKHCSLTTNNILSQLQGCSQGGGYIPPHPTRIVELYFFQIFQNFGLIISKKSWKTWQKLEKLEEKKNAK